MCYQFLVPVYKKKYWEKKTNSVVDLKIEIFSICHLRTTTLLWRNSLEYLQPFYKHLSSIETCLPIYHNQENFFSNLKNI